MRLLRKDLGQLQAVMAEEGMLPLAAAMLKSKATEEAASRLLAGLDDCFYDMVAAAKA